MSLSIALAFGVTILFKKRAKVLSIQVAHIAEIR